MGTSLCTLLIAEARIDYALIVMIASYIMLGVGLLLACALMALYFQRLAMHHLPPRELIVSTFLPLGKSLFSARQILALMLSTQVRVVKAALR